MSQKIYEYKDEHNWFIGEWSPYEASIYYQTVPLKEVSILEDSLRSFLNKLGERTGGPTLTVIRYQSANLFLNFVIDMINSELGRELKASQFRGAFLISEQDKLHGIHIPKEGLSLSAFLGKDDSLGDSILVATRNEGKTKEFQEFFAKLGYGVQNLNDFPELPEVEETGTTFEENARLKAETIAELTGKIVLADDSGLKVDALGGLPGVWSARFSGPDATDAKNNQKLLHELSVVFDQKDRSAQFHCTLVLAKPGKESLVVEADWPGFIAFDSQGEYGFGYDPLFIVESSGKRAAELTTEEKNTQSHRALALKKLMEVFPTWQHD
ncbi:nucleoside-triphosphate diphosphatase [Streptococcus rifensis]